MGKENFEAETPVQKDNVERVTNLIRQIRNWHVQAVEFETKHPDISDKSAEELYKMLTESIQNYLASNPSIQDTSFYGIDYSKMFAEVMDMIKDKEIVRNAFLYYYRMPVSRLVAEFNIRNMDKIVERTIQAGQAVPPQAI
jgi:hypothetical protein